MCYTDSSLSSSSSAAGSENHIFQIYLDFDLNIKVATNSMYHREVYQVYLALVDYSCLFKCYVANQNKIKVVKLQNHSTFIRFHFLG